MFIINSISVFEIREYENFHTASCAFETTNIKNKRIKDDIFLIMLIFTIILLRLQICIKSYSQTTQIYRFFITN